MAEPFLDDLEVLATDEEQRGVRVTEVPQRPDAWQTWMTGSAGLNDVASAFVELERRIRKHRITIDAAARPRPLTGTQ